MRKRHHSNRPKIPMKVQKKMFMAFCKANFQVFHRKIFITEKLLLILHFVKSANKRFYNLKPRQKN